MKFVGKTSVAVIKSAILGAFANKLFFRQRKREQEEGRRKKRKGTCAPLGTAEILRITAKTIWALLINDISIAGSAKSKSGVLGYCPSLSPTRQ